MGPYDPHFLLQNHFPFKNIDVFQKAELIIFIFGHATAILSSEIKIFQFKKNWMIGQKLPNLDYFFKILSFFLLLEAQ